MCHGFFEALYLFVAPGFGFSSPPGLGLSILSAMVHFLSCSRALEKACVGGGAVFDLKNLGPELLCPEHLNPEFLGPGLSPAFLGPDALDPEMVTPWILDSGLLGQEHKALEIWAHEPW